MAILSVAETEGRGIGQGLRLRLRAPLKTSLTTRLPADGEAALSPHIRSEGGVPAAEGCPSKCRRAATSAVLIASSQSPPPSSRHRVSAVPGGHRPVDKGDSASGCTRDAHVDHSKGQHTRGAGRPPPRHNTVDRTTSAPQMAESGSELTQWGTGRLCGSFTKYKVRGPQTPLACVQRRKGKLLLPPVGQARGS